MTNVTDMSDLLPDTLVLGGKKRVFLCLLWCFSQVCWIWCFGWMVLLGTCMCLLFFFALFCYSYTLHGWGLSLISFSTIIGYFCDILQWFLYPATIRVPTEIRCIFLMEKTSQCRCAKHVLWNCRRNNVGSQADKLIEHRKHECNNWWRLLSHVSFHVATLRSKCA